jgi:hypothetical protein
MRGASRWDEDNRLVPNPWAFAAVAAIVGGIAGLALLIWLL